MVHESKQKLNPRLSFVLHGGALQKFNQSLAAARISRPYSLHTLDRSLRQ